MKRLLVVVAAALTLVAVPASASAMILAGDGGGSSGSYCTSGIMNGDGVYYGRVPYYGANTLVQLETTITNWNVLGFVGSADVYTYSTLHVGASFWLRPLGGSVRIVGPTYTTPVSNTSGVPFRIDLGAQSDAVSLAYRVCV